MKPAKVAVVALAIAAWFCLIGVLCSAEPPKPLIEAPEKVEPYRLIEFKAAGDWESVLWEIEPEDRVDVRIGENGKSGIFVAPPGVYKLRAWATNFTQKKQTQAKHSITIGDPPPPPKPEPKPEPKPDPKPKPTTLWGIIIEETAKRTSAHASVILSPKVESLFEPAGRFLVLDAWRDDGARRDLGAASAYAKRADDLKVKPALFIVDPDGTVYYEGRLPETVGEVEALVAKIRREGGS